MRHSEALGGLSRVTLQMDALNSADAASHGQLLQSIELLGRRVAPQLAAPAVANP